MSYICKDCGQHWWGRPEKVVAVRPKTYKIEKNGETEIKQGYEPESEKYVCPRCFSFYDPPKDAKEVTTWPMP